jgi:predicted Zn-dependent peptidase
MYKDNPFWVLYEASLEKHYGSHGMGHRVLGTDQTITALARDQMKSYFDARYSADNTIVALAGNVDLDAAVEQLEQTCGSWQATRPSRVRPAPTPVGGELRLTDAKVARGYLLALASGPAIQDERKYAASLLGQVLGAADNSRLHWSLVETGVAAFDPHDGCGDYYFFASADPDRLDEVWATIRKEIANLGDSLAEEDLELLRNKALTAATLGGERPADRMHRLGRLYTYLGQYQPLEDELDKLHRVTLGDVRDVLRDFPLEPRTVGRLTPA